MAPPPLLDVRSCSKSFGSTVACDAIDLSVARGEIHALLGENGAGKSTLVKMLFGSLRPDRGTIRWRGENVAIASPSHARGLGIGMVFQHFSLFEALTVAQNIALALNNAVPLRRVGERAREVSIRYGLPVDPDALVGDLSAGQRQRVEIVRALMQDPQLLILDEPTSVLTPQEADALFDTLRTMRDEGRSVLYISHRLEEVQRLCDRATVLRRGRVVAACDPAYETAASLASMMVGNEVDGVRPAAATSGEVLFALRTLDAPAESPFAVALRNVDLEVRAGELVCVAGIAGNGQGELFEVVSGERTLPEADAVRMFGHDVGRLGISKRRALGAAFVPEERLGHGSVPEMPLSRNTLLSRHASDRGAFRSGGWLGFLRPARVRQETDEVVRIMDVRSGERDPAAAALSGGNLQKFVVGRELRRSPRLLVVDQPTWGVDAGAAAAIRQAMIDLAETSAVLVISQDLDEIFEIATHVCVISDGRLSAKVPVGDMTRERIGLLMSGLDAAVQPRREAA